MKNIYYVISSNGKIYQPDKYLKSSEISNEMEVCIQREVYNQKLELYFISNYIKKANNLVFSWEKNSQIGFLNYNLMFFDNLS